MQEQYENMRPFQEVFQDHIELSEKGDVDADLERNFSPDCVVLTGFGVFHGFDGIKKLAAKLYEELPNGKYQHQTLLIDKDVAFLEWTATSDNCRVNDGVDSYVYKNGKIIAQTIHYTPIGQQ